MTLDEYYLIVSKMFIPSHGVKIYNTATQLISMIKNINSQPNSQIASDPLGGIKGALDNFKHDIQVTRNDMISMRTYHPYLDEFIGEGISENLNVADNNPFTVIATFLNFVHNIAQKILNAYLFVNAVSSQNIVIDATSDVGNKLSILFEFEAMFSDLNTLSKVSKDWNLIINSFARLVNENNTNVEILSIKRGSLIYEILIPASAILSAITFCGDKVSKTILNILKVKEKILELKGLGLDNISKELDNLEKSNRIKADTLAEDVTNQLLIEYSNKERENDINETKTFLRRAVKKIIVLYSRGGKVEPKFLNPTDKEKDMVTELSKNSIDVTKVFKTIIALETGKKLFLLEEINEDDDNKE